MTLTVQELRAGIRYWPWSRDLHNQFYRDIASCFDGNFDDAWWDCVWGPLYKWRATRGGGTKRAMQARAQKLYPRLNEEWGRHCVPLLKSGADLESVKWDEVAPFADLVTQIKNVRSPVFTSKLCHFLLPRVFPVVDNRAMGNPYRTYADYFAAARTEWLDTPAPVQKQLRSVLGTRIGSQMNRDYPEVSKIVELCFIGRRHP